MKNKNLLIVALVAVVNALGYGIIIPILYSYSKKFGLTDFQNGLLFSIFSICQFISTPIIGRLSDKYGRKPLLIISLAGTFLSFVLMAFAPSAIWLFIARIIDGLTAGNISVVSAVISDSTEGKDRAKGFGIIGASFGFGFVFGPVVSGLTYTLHPTYPFLIAGAISLISLIMTFVMLPETNKFMHEVSNKKFFDLKHLAQSLVDKKVGLTLLISLIYSFAFSAFIYGYQPFAVRAMNMPVGLISANFTAIGIIGVIGQVLIIPIVTKRLGDRTSLILSLAAISVAFFLLGFSKISVVFITLTLFNAFFNAFVNPLIQTLLSNEVDHKSQGSIMGVNSSYVGLGSIFGPLVGGLVATYNISFPFIVAGLSVLVCLYLSLKIKVNAPVDHAF